MGEATSLLEFGTKIDLSIDSKGYSRIKNYHMRSTIKVSACLV